MILKIIFRQFSANLYGTRRSWAAVVLVIAVALSLSAQVVEAELSAIGWIAAAIPALGFLVMVKVALAQTAAPLASAGSALPDIAFENQMVSRVPAGSPPAASRVVLTSVPDGTSAAQAPETTSTTSSLTKESSNGAAATGTEASSDPVVAALVPVARSAVAELDEQGRRLSRHALADALRQEGYGISNARASALLKTLKSERHVSPVLPAKGRNQRPELAVRGRLGLERPAAQPGFTERTPSLDPREAATANPDVAV